jgi:hypothetical protein
MKRTPSIAAFLAAAFLSVAAGLVAHSDEIWTRDNLRRDAGGPLDLSAVFHGHRGGRLVHTLRTYDPWRGRWLQGNRNSIQLTFDGQDDGGESVERVLAIDYRDGELVANMMNVVQERSKVVGRARIERPTRKILRLVFPVRLLKREPLDAYRWEAHVFYDGPGCPTYCADEVPRSGEPGILHNLSG